MFDFFSSSWNDGRRIRLRRHGCRPNGKFQKRSANSKGLRRATIEGRTVEKNVPRGVQIRVSAQRARLPRGRAYPRGILQHFLRLNYFILFFKKKIVNCSELFF